MCKQSVASSGRQPACPAAGRHPHLPPGPSQFRVQFRVYQQRMRHRVKLEDFEQEIRKRRQRHGLDGDVRLTEDLEQQSPLERWIEFQNYQLACLEGFERKRDELNKKL